MVKSFDVNSKLHHSILRTFDEKQMMTATRLIRRDLWHLNGFDTPPRAHFLWLSRGHEFQCIKSVFIWLNKWLRGVKYPYRGMSEKKMTLYTDIDCKNQDNDDFWRKKMSNCNESSILNIGAQWNGIRLRWSYNAMHTRCMTIANNCYS